MKFQFGDRYQLALIGLGVVATGFMGIFFMRELFPEYKKYQENFVALEDFRSSYTGEPAVPFKYEVKQIVFEREDKGPARVERCISCHVALQIPDYSPTVVAKDPEGKVILNEDGSAKLIENENYIWKKLDQQIALLTQEGKTSEAEHLSSLKTIQVGEVVYDVAKVLAAHPLIGNETRPFEYHPLAEYGCVSCHNGNGQGLVTDRAHGPVFDGSYETEYMGFKPEFLEKDEKNDPKFARVFNDKPGHRLLFQTSPIYVGALIQAKCVQCHLTSKETLTVASHLLGTGVKLEAETLDKASFAQIDKLTQEYQTGEQLYISQACYACHRISGVARGGVGPELTREGNSYPWFVKESINWPQADLKTSTMPNYRLDHEELEALLTFLLAQKGEKNALNGTAYKTFLSRWEAGKKQNWEEASPSKEIWDLNYGLTIFATEGCAACHRLKGFESQTTIAKKEDVAWFTTLFPETIIGSDLARIVQEKGAEIDAKILSSSKPALLEKIEKDYPGLIAAFYPSFKFASRSHQDQAYQERLHKVLMAFVQEYGLGRQIGPKPNWSGIYRSNEWLISHFKNPQAEVPRSIMPIMPFDETKFYALTNMLDVVGKKNRDEFRALWTNGFNPEQAYHILCAQCHGDFLEGNGPVSQWIYPIPKNLRRSEFLRNLGRERVIESIVHGVHGTPMVPWGELGKPLDPKIDKSKQLPVLTEKEAEILTDWLFTFLPGGEIIRENQDIPKWNYTPEDVLRELKNEGGELQRKEPLSSLFPTGRGYSAALGAAGTHEPEVNDLFDVKPAGDEDPDKFHYYIKKEYYTQDNIEAGQALFWEHCATCHGNEADGSGLRAEAMHDAKPRMLNNLHWVDSRDDLRLLRSIKFGVPGTSMHAWGDLTNSKQRLQLVIFIRSLTQDPLARTQVLTAIYRSFDVVDQQIELMRSRETPETRKIKDPLWVELKKSLKVEREEMLSLGLSAISQKNVLGESLLNLIKLNEGSFSEKDGKFSYNFPPEKEAQTLEIAKDVEKNLDNRMEELKKELSLLPADSLEANVALKAKITSLENLKKKIINGLQLASDERKKQKLIIEKINRGS